jgi:N-hydroxyarylamine O-acetyltransferase
MAGSLLVKPLDPDLCDRFLRHLGLEGTGDERLRTPSAESLRLLQGAMLDRVPYENLEIQLGRPTSIDPAESVCRILTGRGGYCFHLNGSFAALLASLGYAVTLVRGAVPAAGDDGRWWGNHMVLLVRFGRARTRTATWVADVGMGDGFREPVRLVDGAFHQQPFRYRLRHVGGCRWRFHHDERATTAGFDLDVTPVGLASFVAMHRFLSTSPESSFVLKSVVQRRSRDHTLTLRGCVLTRVDGSGRTVRDVTTEEDWYGLVADEFGVRLHGVSAEERHALWTRVRSMHEAWDRAGRP